MLQDTVDFCEKNSKNSPEFPVPIGESINQMFEYIIKQASTGHLLIPSIKIPVDLILDEAKSLLFNPHVAADRYLGRNAFMIFGLSADRVPYNQVHTIGNDTIAEYYNHGTWVNKEQAPKITQYFQNEFPVTQYTHITIMKLEPGGWIDPHTDVFSNQKNINIPLTLPKNSMSCNLQGKVTYEIGCPTIFNVGILHAIYNNSSEDRYMISVGAKEYSDKFKNETVKEYLKQRKSSLQASR